MGVVVSGTHDEMLQEDGWNKLQDVAPPEYTDIYLRCCYMMDEFVVVGQVANNKRVKSDGDPDIFFRSAVLYWKEYNSNNEKANVVELTYGQLKEMLDKQLAENPSLIDEKAIIHIGNSSNSRSSYVKGMESVNNEIVIKGSYYNGRPVE